jgi:hypothetical protein
MVCFTHTTGVVIVPPRAAWDKGMGDSQPTKNLAEMSPRNASIKKMDPGHENPWTKDGNNR